jgi:hypothetical protein
VGTDDRDRVPGDLDGRHQGRPPGSVASQPAEVDHLGAEDGEPGQHGDAPVPRLGVPVPWGADDPLAEWPLGVEEDGVALAAPVERSHPAVVGRRVGCGPPPARQSVLEHRVPERPRYLAGQSRAGRRRPGLLQHEDVGVDGPARGDDVERPPPAVDAGVDVERGDAERESGGLTGVRRAVRSLDLLHGRPP